MFIAVFILVLLFFFLNHILMLAFFYKFKNFFLVSFISEFLRIEVLLVIQKSMLKVVLAQIAPERKVGKWETDGMLTLVEMLLHVAVYIATAKYLFALQTDPNFSLNVTNFAGSIHMCILEFIDVSDIIVITMRTVSLGSHCNKPFHYGAGLILHFSSIKNL